MSKLEGPFSGDVKSAPSPTSAPKAKDSQAECVNQPEDTSVLHTVFFVDEPGLKGSVSKAKLESPFESDFRPGVDSSKK
jgi:hypothetical protein